VSLVAAAAAFAGRPAALALTALNVNAFNTRASPHVLYVFFLSLDLVIANACDSGARRT
jgi:hypothetical protein